MKRREFLTPAGLTAAMAAPVVLAWLSGDQPRVREAAPPFTHRGSSLLLTGAASPGRADWKRMEAAGVSLRDARFGFPKV